MGLQMKGARIGWRRNKIDRARMARVQHLLNDWRDDPGTLVSGWRIIAQHVVNRTDNPQVTAFALDNSDSAYGNRLVKVTIVVDDKPSSGSEVRIQSSVEGRDTTFGYPNSACADVPPY